MIASSETFKNLRVLNLYRNKITDKGAKAIAESDTLSSLIEINLNYNEIGDEGSAEFDNVF